MRFVLVCVAFLFTSPLFSLLPPPSTDKYLDYLNTYPKLSSYLGDAAKGEIEIILDKDLISTIQTQTGRHIGIIGNDTYWVWINDPVKFPSGKYGVYGRLLWKQSLTRDHVGVAVMPILPNGKIILIRNFRHATRSWEYELPRGAVNVNESIESAALREVKEETGMIVDDLQLLGHIATDSGVTNSIVPIFSAKIASQKESEPEDSEAIAAIESFSIEDLKQGFVDGYLSATIDGKLCKIPLRDPFLAFALFQTEIRLSFKAN